MQIYDILFAAVWYNITIVIQESPGTPYYTPKSTN